MNIQGILTNKMYTQRELKLKFNTVLNAYDIKLTENSKNIIFQNNFKKLKYFFFIS